MCGFNVILLRRDLSTTISTKKTDVEHVLQFQESSVLTRKDLQSYLAEKGASDEQLYDFFPLTSGFLNRLLLLCCRCMCVTRDTGTFCEQTVVTLAGIRGQLTARGV